jgi:arylsulfatase A-like enzyme
MMACSSPPPAALGRAAALPVRHDLAADFPHAEVDEESTLAVGLPEARRRLIGGWAEPERQVDGSALVWGLGPASLVDLFVGRPRDLAIEFRGEPVGGASPQSFDVRLNGSPVGAVSMRPGLQTYSVPVPAKLLRFGDNRLELRYAVARPPAENGGVSTDHRPLAVAWRSIGLAAATPATNGGSKTSADGTTLRIAAGTRVSYFTSLGTEARLTFTRLSVEGGTSCSLSIAAEGALGGRTFTTVVSPTDVPARVAIDMGADAAARVSLAADCSEERSGRAPVITLVQPYLETTRPESVGTAPPKPSPSRTGPPNVFVYLVDTLRRDHVGCYGYSRPITPRLDAFRRDAILYAGALAPTSWTRPSVGSLMTGLPPRVHGAIRGDDALAPGARTLAQILGGAGYHTAAVVANGHVSATFGFSRGFDHFVETDATAATDVNRKAFHWLDEMVRAAPLFLYAHVIEPHDPYDPPPIFRRRFAPHVRTPGAGSVEQLAGLTAAPGPVSPTLRGELVDLYDAEIAAADDAFGAFLDALRERGLYDDALVVFCADHGEELEDHGRWLHGATLYEEVLQVPLLVKLPRGRLGGTVREGLVQHVDLFTSILAEAGAGEADPERDVFASPLAGGTERCLYYSLDAEPHHAGAIRCGRWKLIREEGNEAQTHLYDLRDDPSESRDRADAEPERARLLLALLRARERSETRAALPRARADVDPELRERLRALGYVQ